MDIETRRQLIASYRDGYRAVAQAIEALPPGALDHRPNPAAWTPREVVHHVSDFDMVTAARLRQLLTEENAVIHGFDEQAVTRRCHYERSLEASLAAMAAVRESSAQILDLLDEEEWARKGAHDEYGPYSIERLIQTQADHAREHARQIATIGDA